MGIDLPPNLAGQAAAAIVRQAEQTNQTPTVAQTDARRKEEKKDGGNLRKQK